MKKTTFLLAILLLTAVACISGSDKPITVSDLWGRTSPAVAANGAFYMTLNNNSSSDDALIAVATDACGMVELHEMYDKGEGVMGMRPIEGGVIPILAGGTTELKPGGMHVMCMDKQIDFAAGTEVPLTLTFENAGEVVVTAVIRDN
jgi:copper(I)-binding protein